MAGFLLWQNLILGGAFEQEGSGAGGAGAVGRTQYVRGNYTSFKGTNLTVVEEMHQFIYYTRYTMYKLYQV